MIIQEEHSTENDKPSGYGELKQSKAAVWSAVIIIILNDISTVVSYLIAPDSSDITIFDNPFLSGFSILIDIYLVVNLLRGKSWARRWMLIRIVIGFIVFGIVYLVGGDYPSLVIIAGGYSALILLLTGTGTLKRIVASVMLLVGTLIGGFVWTVGILLTPVEVEDYNTVNINGLNCAVPVNWISTEGYYSELFEEYGDDEWFVFRSYGDETGSVELCFILMDLKLLCETEDYSWQGWDQFESDMLMSKRDFCEIFIYGVLSGYDNVVKIGSNEVSVNFQECYEYLHTAENDGIPLNINFLAVFSKETLGIISMVCEGRDWSIFQGSWPRIRDSVMLE